MLINGARDLGGLGVTARDQNFGTVSTVQNIPDNHQGWGMLSFERLFGTWTNYYFYDQGTALTTSGTTWTSPALTARDLTKPINVTLVWSDPAGMATTSHYSVINNLDLIVYAGPNTTLNWQGNDLINGITQPRPPAPIYHDDVNNVERVVIPANELNSTHRGVTVTVFARSISSSQTFAIAVENAGQ